MSVYQMPDNWDSLPIKTVKTGDTKRNVKYDEATNTVYLLDEHGEWTGKKGTPPRQKSGTVSDVSDVAGSSAEQQNDSASEKTVENGKTLKRKAKKQKSKWTPVLIGIIIVLVIMLIVQNSNTNMLKQDYTVIIAMEDIEPGESIAGKLSSLTISAEEYQRQSSLSGLYNANDYSAIKGYVATSFIPQDGYVTYTNVGQTFQPSNPWMLTGQEATINIPISVDEDSLSEILWGNKIIMTITVEHVIDIVDMPDVYRPTSPDIESNTTYKTYQVDTYTLSDITILDVLNAKQISLYNTYAALAAIPTPYLESCLETRYASSSQKETEMPAYIQIEVSKATAQWWEGIKNRKQYPITVSIEVTGANCETQLQNETYTALKKLIPALQSVWGSDLEE